VIEKQKLYTGAVCTQMKQQKVAGFVVHHFEWHSARIQESGDGLAGSRGERALQIRRTETYWIKKGK
jgi:hypothetical protein